MTWPSVPGRNYQMQYKTNLQDAVWNQLGAAINAAGLSTSVTNNLGSAKRRFYRLLLAP